MRERFAELADRATYVLGSPFSIVAAVLLITIWLVSGPIFGFSDTWQLVINTTTTIITFIMVFVIQASTNRSSKALMLKLDEILLALPEVEPDEAIGAEKLPEDKVDRLAKKLRASAQSQPAKGKSTRPRS